MTIRERDGGADSLVRLSGDRARVRIGVMGAKASQRKTGSLGETVAGVASIHEFGLGVPRRSFIADWADENEADAAKRLKNISKRAISEGREIADYLDLFGVWAQGSIQKRISARIPPPLSKARIKQKGSDVPLIDTGQLRSSITYEVSDG